MENILQSIRINKNSKCKVNSIPDFIELPIDKGIDYLTKVVNEKYSGNEHNKYSLLYDFGIEFHNIRIQLFNNKQLIIFLNNNEKYMSNIIFNTTNGEINLCDLYKLCKLNGNNDKKKIKNEKYNIDIYSNIERIRLFRIYSKIRFEANYISLQIYFNT